MTGDDLAQYGPPMPEAPLPKVTIPAQEEITMTGISGLLQPTIMKCALGGWMIIIPGKGVASKSELSEAIGFLEDYAYEFFGEQRRDMPKIFNKAEDMAPESTAAEGPGFKEMWSIRGAAHALGAMIALAFGVKLAT